VVSSDRGEVLEGPCPSGASIAEALSAARGFFDDDVPGLVTVDLGGLGRGRGPRPRAGVDGDRVGRGPATPPEPYPVGGLAVYRGPVKPGTSVPVRARPPPPPTTPPPPTCTRRAATTRAASGCWSATRTATARPTSSSTATTGRPHGSPGPADDRGLAFFPSGTPGAVELDAAPLTLYGLCGSRAHGPAERRRRHRRRPRRRRGHLPRGDGPRGRVRRPPPRRPHRPPLPRHRLPRDHRPRPEHRQRQRLRPLHPAQGCRTSTATASGSWS
jgi:hypothetical protein